MKKRILALVLAGAMLAMTACSSSSSSEDTTEESTEETAEEETEEAEEEAAEEEEEEAAEEEAEETASSDEVFTIGICQLVQHDALDAATQGFIDTLVAYYGEDGVIIDEQNAQNDTATCSTIVTSFVANEYDLILANATAPLQAAVSATSDIPILGTSVTDYATALEIDDWDGTTGINVSGTSDLAPLDGQVEMILELVPDVQKVGIIYCSAEANSVYQATVVGEYLDEAGVEWAEYTFADSNDMQSVVTAAAQECDVIYIPTDNTAASNMTIVANVCEPLGIPVICGEEGMAGTGGLAALSISYYDLGVATGEMAIEILSNGADVSTMEIQYSGGVTKKYNAEYAEAIGIEIPEDYEVIE